MDEMALSETGGAPLSPMINNKILSLYTRGLSSTEIQDHFRNNYHVQFSFSGDSSNPTIYATIPDYAVLWADTSSPHQIVIAPGEAIILSTSWNQSFINHNGEPFTALPVGTYSMFITIPAGGSRYRQYAVDYRMKFIVQH